MELLIRTHRDHGLVAAIPYREAAARIDALAGRSIGAYIVGTALPYAKRRHGRAGAYVSVNRGSLWHREHGTRGFHVLDARDAAIEAGRQDHVSALTSRLDSELSGA